MNDPFQKRPAPALLAALVFVGVLTTALAPWNGRRLPRAAAAAATPVLDTAENAPGDAVAPVARIAESLPEHAGLEPVPESQ